MYSELRVRVAARELTMVHTGTDLAMALVTEWLVSGHEADWLQR